MSEKIATVDELQELFDLPTTDEPEVKNAEETEWLENCSTGLGSWDAKHNMTCPEVAIANLTLVCPFCGPNRSGKCKKHLDQGLKGELVCSGCSRKAGTAIPLKPLSCVWKSDD